MRPGLAEALAVEGVIALREHRSLRAAIKTALRRGEIVALLRGVYTVPEAAGAFRIRCRAVMLADPDAVLHGATAAVVHGWGAEPTVIDVVSHRLHPRSWLRISRRRLDPEQIEHRPGARVSRPETTALDNAARTEGASVDDALRSGVSLELLHAAMAHRRHRRGVRFERKILRDSRDKPWSPAERHAHVLLRAARITGWSTNLAIHCPGRTVFADIALEALRLDLEIDGDKWHLSPSDVRRDRERDLALAEQGWTVVCIPAQRVFNDPDGFVASVLAILRTRTPRRRRRASEGVVTSTGRGDGDPSRCATRR